MITKKTKKPRVCQACGSDCSRKPVGEKYFSKVICQKCHFSGYAVFDKNGEVVINPENDYMRRNKMYPVLEDALLRGDKLHIVIDFSGTGEVDITVENNGEHVFSDLAFPSLDEALRAVCSQLQKHAGNE